MMQLQYDDDFVEGAVFVCVNSRHHGPPPFQVRRFHREREKLYGILDPDERNTAFFQLHLEWFRERGLEKILIGLVDEFPLLRASLGALAFHKARVKNDEGAELFVSTGNRRTGVVALRSDRFDHPEELACFLRHEFTHVQDMVDPAFGYSPQLHLPGQNAAQQRLTRERYRLLWDITIDGRLTLAPDMRRRIPNPEPPQPPADAERPTVTSHAQHRAAFERAFNFWSENKREEVFASLWQHPNPRHEALLAIASDPRDVKSAQEPTPGAPCPLCGFATFQWADAARFSESTIAAIRKEFPHWTADQGACARCLEIYRLMGAPSLAMA